MVVETSWQAVGKLGPMRFVRHAGPWGNAGVWVSLCPFLDLRSQGRTRREAVDALDDAIAYYLAYCPPRVLAEKGIARGEA